MPCGDYIDCDNSELSIDDLIRLLIQTDSNGCPALKIVNTATTDIVLYQTNFSNGGALPDGWEVTGQSEDPEFPSDFIIDNDDTYLPNSSGYNGASGGYKLVCTDAGWDALGYVTYETGFSTLGKENIRLLFGNICISTGFWPEYSIDSGAWVQIGGGEINNATWTLTEISIAALANQTNVRIRFYRDIQSGGNYAAMDDVKILADLIL